MIELERGSRKEAERWIGLVAEPRECPLVVSTVHGQVFCCMVDDANPLYWEPARTRAALGYDAVPAAALMTFGLPLPWSPQPAPHRPLWAHVPLPGDTIINVATTTELPSPLPAGARLTVTERVTAISELRRTRVGDGYFLTTRAEYHDDEGTLRATHDNTMLRYASSYEQRPVGDEDDGAAHMAPDGSPLFELDVDRRRLALNVAATWDLFPGHHDDEYARSQGVPASYVNTLFLHALVDRAGTEFGAGPDDLCVPVRRRLVMRRPVVVGTRVAVWCEADPSAPGTPARRRRVVVTHTGRVCVEATVDVATVSQESIA